MITSLTNPTVKRIKRLVVDRRFRKREQAYIVEGVRWLRDLLAMGQAPQTVCYTERWQTEPLLAQIAGHKLLVSDAVMAGMSDVETPSGVL
ncbi:MAG: hypothetical protein ACPG8W_20050, partial [Candidatus Promineifilaceae bacterium]